MTDECQLHRIVALVEELKTEQSKQETVKACCTRQRKRLLDLAKICKEQRKYLIDHHKKKQEEKKKEPKKTDSKPKKRSSKQ